jgi:predicted phage terminase large subunit-like protein
MSIRQLDALKIDHDKEEFASLLRGSLIEFTAYFTKYITGRDFIIAEPLGQKASQITLCRALTSIFRLENPGHNHSFHIAPGTGKTLQMCMFVAWTYTHYSDCNYLYISNAKDLATMATAFIKQIMTSEMYVWLFDVDISRDSRAKEHFATTGGGNVAAFGSDGGITGRNAGLPILDRWSGCVLYDDAEKPKTVHSDTIRLEIQRNYRETIAPRPRSPVVPILYIGQRLHEDDLANYFITGKDVRQWIVTLLPSEDVHGNALHPHLYSPEYLSELREKAPYVYWSQHMQNPLPSGGSLFKPEWIVQLDKTPDILVTFITADTAETADSWNDASVFSFWGVYEIEYEGRKTGDIGLHWIDTVELRIEPKDLKEEFLDFWGECHRFKVPPTIAAIEKKSTGVTLVSVLRDLRGITIRDIKRDRSSGSKGDRFVECQSFVGARLVSINANAKHKDLVLSHISKITANNTHRHDDIMDTFCDAINIALVEKTIGIPTQSDAMEQQKMLNLRQSMLKRHNLR